jgi:hypothetical protein
MFSEGADTNASMGVLHPHGGFCIVISDRTKPLEGQRRKTPNLKLPASPERKHTRS